MRAQTEWVELVEHGFNVLVGPNKNEIKNAYSKMVSQPLDFDKDLYGDGQAAKAILDHLKSRLAEGQLFLTFAKNQLSV